MILQPDAIRWFKPAKDQVQIFYRIGSIPQPYVPDFVAEIESDEVIETKARNEMAAPEVMAKRQVAEEWCVSASAYAATYRGKIWRYALIPHDIIADNMSLASLGGHVVR